MDNEASVLQVLGSDGKFAGFRYLTPLQRDPIDGDEIAALWEKVKEQDYAFDDISRGRVDWFLCQLADVNSDYLKIGNHGLFMINHPIKGGTADIHFVVWDKEYSLYRDREAALELLDWLFFEKQVHRVQGMVPNYNKLAQRFVLSHGFKYEGEMLDAVLWKGKYWSVQMYGLVEQSYRERRERMRLQ